MLDRVLTHLKNEDVDTDLINEYITIATDRICLRLGEETCPPQFNSIIVDVVVKLYRRHYFEGIDTENTAGESVKFIQDALSEYEYEFGAYLKRKKQATVRFL